MNYIANLAEPIPDTLDVEEALISLCKLGEPRISKHDTGWYAAIDMFVNVVGAKFKIDTGFNNATPSAAMKVLIERTRNVLKLQGA